MGICMHPSHSVHRQQALGQGVAPPLQGRRQAIQQQFDCSDNTASDRIKPAAESGVGVLCPPALHPGADFRVVRVFCGCSNARLRSAAGFTEFPARLTSRRGRASLPSWKCTNWSSRRFCAAQPGALCSTCAIRSAFAKAYVRLSSPPFWGVPSPAGTSESWAARLFRPPMRSPNRVRTSTCIMYRNGIGQWPDSCEQVCLDFG